MAACFFWGEGPVRSIVLGAVCAAALACLVSAAMAGPIPRAERADLRREYILANTEFTVLHEVAHVVFQEFDVPLFGQEEESADTLATMLMILNYGIDVDPRHMDRLLMVSAEWYDEWQVLDKQNAARSYWDDHPLSIQRFYNINCLAFGANEEMLGLLLDHPSDLLPVERGWFCDRESARAKAAAFWIYDHYRKKPPAQDKGHRIPKPMITVTWEEPDTEEAKKGYDILRSDGLVERMAGRLDALLAWPNPISINFVNCGASTEAYYNERVHGIFICAGLIAQFGQMADYQADQGTDRLCHNLAIRRLMGERLGCPPDRPQAAEKGQTLPGRVRTR